ncbi:hypothetical protein Tsp_16057 [Trichinella spiralis]|uniref:hypothetical protein n=1 Tax=Trichinella spiralis TaxID=6334 RepID=UPI0001EFDB0B|nr:hypothetical protein Tsp_16057 [Trichinella spiralis]
MYPKPHKLERFITDITIQIHGTPHCQLQPVPEVPGFVTGMISYGDLLRNLLFKYEYSRIYCLTYCQHENVIIQHDKFLNGNMDADGVNDNGLANLEDLYRDLKSGWSSKVTCRGFVGSLYFCASLLLCTFTHLWWAYPQVLYFYNLMLLSVDVSGVKPTIIFALMHLVLVHVQNLPIISCLTTNCTTGYGFD